MTYPQLAGVGPARTVTYDVTNGALTRVHEGASNFASSITYHDNEMVNTVTHGNALQDVYGADPHAMKRPASVSAKPGGLITLWTTGTYGYDGAGNIFTMGSDTYTYDLVSRLKEGTVASVAKKQCMVFDAFGNAQRADVIPSSGTCATTPSISLNSATNRLNYPVIYDDAGEQRSWNSGTYTYSWYPTGQMQQYSGSNRTTIYAYTADGERIGTYDSTAPAGISYTLRGLDNKVLRVYRETGGVWSWVQDYVYRDGSPLATVDSTGTRHFTLDHLGTVRLVTNASGSQVALHTYMPFGQEGTNAYQDMERTKYTGHERDLRDTSNTTDDLDYMHARYYNPNIGRFLSVDPVRGNPKRPQSFNLYSYVVNNPLTLIDPDGRNWFNVSGNWQWHEGSEWKDKAGKKYTSNFTHLLVVTSTGKTNKSGATLFNVTLYNQNKVAMTGTAFSGGSGHPRVPAGNYTIRGDIQDPVGPSRINPGSPLNNPDAYYGMQVIGSQPVRNPANGLLYDVQSAYGALRAYLNPDAGEFASQLERGNYYHGQSPNAPGAGSTHGCLCYGQDPSIINYLWGLGAAVPVPIDQPVETP